MQLKLGNGKTIFLNDPNSTIIVTFEANCCGPSPRKSDDSVKCTKHLGKDRYSWLMY